jgi:hypothetical protein
VSEAVVVLGQKQKKYKLFFFVFIISDVNEIKFFHNKRYILWKILILKAREQY